MVGAGAMFWQQSESDKQSESKAHHYSLGIFLVFFSFGFFVFLV